MRVSRFDEINKKLDTIGTVPNFTTPAERSEETLLEIKERLQDLSELERIADAAEKQATLAQSQSEAARIAAKKSNCRAFWSLIVSIISVIVVFLSNFQKIKETLMPLMSLISSLLTGA